MKFLLSTGSAGLDQCLGGVQSGDTFLWQVDSVAHYVPFVLPLAEHASRCGKRVIYFHFADIEPLFGTDGSVDRVDIHPQAGFEAFIERILDRIQRDGDEAYYVFDCISPLAADWHSDQMVGNFFMIVCPYLHELNTITYFSILRNYHSHYATDPVSQTARILIDVYRHREHLYVQPHRVAGRYTNRMFTLHAWDAGKVRPVQDSYTASEVLNASRWETLGLARHHLGIWSRTFAEAETLVNAEGSGPETSEKAEAMRLRILRMAISRDERMLQLAERFFTLADLVFLGTRMLGTGLIGGKAVDMILARNILCRTDDVWRTTLEMHDAFFVPSDVFYTYLVQNKCWELRRRQLHAQAYLDGAEEARQRILEGEFPQHIMKRFGDMLDYFGQAPVVVRSSSLLEDSFGNAFSGKYESVFCANQGTRANRLSELVSAIKQVYASTMSHDALEYRAAHGLLKSDEQMSLLVQRVTGAYHGRYFFPHVAAVGFSFNPYVWNPDIDPKAGVLRLVFGLGTRAVDRSDGDYTRLVSLNAPELSPETRFGAVSVRSQQKVDVLDLERGCVLSVGFQELASEIDDLPFELFASNDPALVRYARERGMNLSLALQLTFERLITHTSFVGDMRRLLEILEAAYAHPVDIEFAAQFDHFGKYRLALLQCRPLHAKGVSNPVLPAPACAEGDILLSSTGPVIGRSRMVAIDHLVYVFPAAYSALSPKEQYAVARIIGRLNRTFMQWPDNKETVLIGPGRWGSTIPALGIPVSFAEISQASAICELLELHEGLTPEVSLGTHFFNDLVEVDMLFLAVSPKDETHKLNSALLETMPNSLVALLPDAEAWAGIIRVVLFGNTPESSQQARLWADTMKQQAIIYLEQGAS